MTEQSMVSVSPEVGDAGAEVVRRVNQLPAAEAAAIIAVMSPDEAAAVIQQLDGDAAARIVGRMERGAAAVIACVMEPARAAALLERVAPDDRVDILGHLPAEVHEEIVGVMKRELAAEVRQLEQYPPDTAGGLMTTQVIGISEHITVENAIALLRRMSRSLGQAYYLYVITPTHHLRGVLSMRDLILAEPETPLSQIMNPAVQSVPIGMGQREVATIIRTHGYMAMPVVDGCGRLVGMITLDDVVKVIEDEATEEVQKMFGAGAQERLTTPWPFSLRKRFWWLEVNLITAFVGAGIVTLFSGTIAALPILAAYQTIVASMGANAGAQAMAIAIRGIATGESTGAVLRRVLRREFMVGLISGVGIGLTTVLIILILRQSDKSLLIGTVVCAALILNHINGCVTGVCVPFLMKRLGLDPAQSASIIATTITDCGGFLACLGLARFALHLLGVPV